MTPSPVPPAPPHPPSPPPAPPLGVRAGPPGWPWPRPGYEIPYGAQGYEEQSQRHDEWDALHKLHGGMVYPYGRHHQWLFRWQDARLPNGRFACRHCGASPSGRRRFYCGKPCERAWARQWISPTHWPNWRRKAIQRDGGRCVLCGDGEGSPEDLRDEEAERRARDEAYELIRAGHHARDDPKVKALFAHASFLHERMRGRRLEVDHVVPVARDPSREYDLENLRTLCHACHASHGARPRGIPLPVPSHARLPR